MTRYLHVNSNLMGFLKSDGNWDMYMNNSGSMWTANYGWLHDYFFNAVSNCFRSNNPTSGWQGAPNCVANTADYYNCGDQAPPLTTTCCDSWMADRRSVLVRKPPATTATATATAAEEGS